MTFKYKKKNTAPALTLDKTTLINCGEIFVIVGLPGQGKTAICEAIVTACLGKQNFGFVFNGHGKKALIIDTERPKDDVSDSYHNIAKRIGNPTLDADGEIKGLVHLSVSEFADVVELKSILAREIATCEFDLIELDGIIDFCLSMNDDKDATELVKWVRSLAVKFNVAMVLTIHPNKATDIIAGHLGAFLYRWARAILFVRPVKGDKSVKELTGEPDMAKLSHGDLATLQPGYFSWDHDLELLMPYDYQPKEDRAKEEKMQKAFNIVLRMGKDFESRHW